LTYSVVEYVADTQQEVGFDIVVVGIFCAGDQSHLSLSDDFSGLNDDFKKKKED
jgi:hypothetical protein